MTVVITGASSGIGEATARMFANKGACVVAGARRRNRLNNLAQELNEQTQGQLIPVETDVCEASDVDNLFSIASQEGNIEVVVVNAGLAHPGDVATMPDEHYREMTGVNVDGVFFTARAALPYLQKTHGNIVFMGSFAGVYPQSGNPVYAATKWWVRGFAKSLLGQIGSDDIGVSIINPSEVRTEFGHQRGASAADRFEVGEVTEAGAVAEAIDYVTSQEDVDTVLELNLYRKNMLREF